MVWVDVVTPIKGKLSVVAKREEVANSTIKSVKNFDITSPYKVKIDKYLNDIVSIFVLNYNFLDNF
jgi:hypothetical protein